MNRPDFPADFSGAQPASPWLTSGPLAGGRCKHSFAVFFYVRIGPRVVSLLRDLMTTPAQAPTRPVAS